MLRRAVHERYRVVAGHVSADDLAQAIDNWVYYWNPEFLDALIAKGVFKDWSKGRPGALYRVLSLEEKEIASLCKGLKSRKARLFESWSDDESKAEAFKTKMRGRDPEKTYDIVFKKNIPSDQRIVKFSDELGGKITKKIRERFIEDDGGDETVDIVSLLKEEEEVLVKPQTLTLDDVYKIEHHANGKTSSIDVAEFRRNCEEKKRAS